jgi:CsoR family transcriptional regulator, copper-sensing transcriptional repressor
MTGQEVKLDDIQKEVLSRLRMIEGQIRGVQKMILGNKKCEDILIQTRAVRSALQSANSLILQRYITQCLRDATKNTTTDEALDQIQGAIKTLTHYVTLP